MAGEPFEMDTSDRSWDEWLAEVSDEGSSEEGAVDRLR
jgi:hypothetical protein